MSLYMSVFKNFEGTQIKTLHNCIYLSIFIDTQICKVNNDLGASNLINTL